MKKTKISVAGLVIGIINALVVTLLVSWSVWRFFYEATHGPALFYIGDLFVTPLIFLSLALVLVYVILFFADAKGKGKLFTAIPSFAMVFVVIVSCLVCQIYYVNADKATYGIPAHEQEILQIDYMVNYAMKMEEPKFVIGTDYQNKKSDSSHQLIQKLKQLNPEGPIDPALAEGKKSRGGIQYILGTDDFYGLTVYKSGIIDAADHGDLLSSPYDLYYTFDADLFSDFYQFALSLT